MRFGLSAFVIARDTEAEALAELDRLQALVDAEKRPESRRAPTRRPRCTRCFRTPAGSVQRRHARRPGRQLLPGRRTHRAFHEAGIELFMLQFQPLEADWTGSPTRSFPVFVDPGRAMTLDVRRCTPRPTRPTAWRFGRRAADPATASCVPCAATTPAAERGRVLQYEAVGRCAPRGVLALRVPAATADPAAASATCCRR